MASAKSQTCKRSAIPKVTSAQNAVINFNQPYPDVLSEAWRLHQSPKSKLTVVSTFAGGGGSSLGYSIAGFDERLAVEWDNHAVATFKKNISGVNVYHGDITKLSRKECLDLSGLEEGELDVLDGSPPCQGFSLSGKRQLEDDRNQLFLAYAKLLDILKPRTFVMENVRGLVVGKMKAVFSEIKSTLEACDYDVVAALLNTKFYHVPQSRERVIFIGVRKDLKLEPTFPAPSGDVLTLAKALTGAETIGPEIKGKAMALLPFMRPGEDGSKVLGRINKRQSYFNLIRTSWHKPAPTITKTVSASRGGLVHPEQPNLLSIAALKRLASFPDEFEMTGSFQEQWARIGNSVPPLFMYQIAGHTRTMLLNA
jgi:DNA (cytosine-5)-methyltransferase 1